MGSRVTGPVAVYRGDVMAANDRIRVTKINGQVSGEPYLTVKDRHVTY